MIVLRRFALSVSLRIDVICPKTLAGSDVSRFPSRCSSESMYSVFKLVNAALSNWLFFSDNTVNVAFSASNTSSGNDVNALSSA